MAGSNIFKNFSSIREEVEIVLEVLGLENIEGVGEDVEDDGHILDGLGVKAVFHSLSNGFLVEVSVEPIVESLESFDVPHGVVHGCGVISG